MEVPGRTNAVWWARDILIESKFSVFNGERVDWKLIIIPKLHFYMATSLMVLQGVHLGRLLFPPDGKIQHRGCTLFEGPFTFLERGEREFQSAVVSNVRVAKTPPIPAQSMDVLSILGTLLEDSKK